MADNRSLANLASLLALPSPAASTPKKQPPTAANDNNPQPRDVLAWPTLERLAYRGDEARVAALRHWRNLCYPGVEYTPPAPDDANIEAAIEIRPSETELLKAIGWEVIGKVRCPATGDLVARYDAKQVAEARVRNRNGGIDTALGSLKFRDGRLIQWGSTAKGAVLKPVERPRAPKGAQLAAGRSDAAVSKYLRSRPTTPSPFEAVSLHRPFSGVSAIHDCYEPLTRKQPSAEDKHGRFGAEEARELLREFGVDGAVPFDRLPVAAMKCPDGIVGGPQWVGGVKKPKPTGEISAAAFNSPELDPVATEDYLDHLRGLLRDHARVLDLAITDASAKAIAIEMGKASAYAEKIGPVMINAAIDALILIDETARPTQQKEKIAA